MRILKRWYFGFCWNLRLVIIELWSLEGFWFSFRGFFWRLGIVSHGEIFEFPSFSFCLKMLFNLNGKAMLWHTHCFFFFAMSQFWLAHHSQKKFKMKICSLPKIQCSTLKYRFSLLSPTYNIYIYIYIWKEDNICQSIVRSKVKCYGELFREHVKNFLDSDFFLKDPTMKGWLLDFQN